MPESLLRFQDELDGLGSRFKLKSVLGQGSYGAVLKAEDAFTGTAVAIKRVHPRILLERDLAVRILREVLLLRYFNHPNILYLSHYICNKKILDLTELQAEVQQLAGQSQPSLYLVTPLVDTDLRALLGSPQELTNDHVAYLMYQLLCGLKCIHSCGVAHRDLTPGNILVNIQHCDLKIADLGLAREVPEANKGFMTEYVTVRWYRSPEVLLSSRHYGVEVDLWAAACIFAELLGAQPLFQGTHTAHQLMKIIAVVGTPSDDVMRAMSSSPDTRDYVLRQRVSKPNVGAAISTFKIKDQPDAISLFKSLLQFDPARRLPAAQALRHKYFEEFSDPESAVEKVKACQNFTFDPMEYKTSMDVRNRLVNLSHELKRANRKACISATTSAGIAVLALSVYSRLIVCEYPIRIGLSFNPSHRTVSVSKQGSLLMPRFALADPPEVRISVGLHPNAKWKQVATAISNFLTLEVNSLRHKAQQAVVSVEHTGVRGRHHRVASHIPGSSTPRPATPRQGKMSASAKHTYSKSMPDFFAMGVADHSHDHDSHMHESNNALSRHSQNPLAVFTPRGKNRVADNAKTPPRTPVSAGRGGGGIKPDHARSFSSIQLSGAAPHGSLTPASHGLGVLSPPAHLLTRRPVGSPNLKNSPEMPHLSLQLAALHHHPSHHVDPNWGAHKLRGISDLRRPAWLSRDLAHDAREEEEGSDDDHDPPSVHDYGSDAADDLLDIVQASPPAAPTVGKAMAHARSQPFPPATLRDPTALVAALLAPKKPPFGSKRMHTALPPTSFHDARSGDMVMIGVSVSGRCLLYRVCEAIPGTVSPTVTPRSSIVSYQRPRHYHVNEVVYEASENRIVFPALRKAVNLPPVPDVGSQHPLVDIAMFVWATGIQSNLFAPHQPSVGGPALTPMPQTKSTVVCPSVLHYDAATCEVPDDHHPRPVSANNSLKGRHGRTHSNTVISRSNSASPRKSRFGVSEAHHVNQSLEAKFDASLMEAELVGPDAKGGSLRTLTMDPNAPVLKNVQRAFPSATIASDYNFTGAVRCFVTAMDVQTFCVGTPRNTPRTPRGATATATATATPRTATPRSPQCNSLATPFGMRRSGRLGDEAHCTDDVEGETSTVASSIDFEPANAHHSRTNSAGAGTDGRKVHAAGATPRGVAKMPAAAAPAEAHTAGRGGAARSARGAYLQGVMKRINSGGGNPVAAAAGSSGGGGVQQEHAHPPQHPAAAGSRGPPKAPARTHEPFSPDAPPSEGSSRRKRKRTKRRNSREPRDSHSAPEDDEVSGSSEEEENSKCGCECTVS